MSENTDPLTVIPTTKDKVAKHPVTAKAEAAEGPGELVKGAIREEACEIEPNEHYKGHVDGIFDGYIAGWVVNLSDPQEQVVVHVKEGDVVLDEVIANNARQDLLLAGFPDSSHGFLVPIPELLKDGQCHSLTVVIPTIGKVLEGTAFFQSTLGPHTTLAGTNNIPSSEVTIEGGAGLADTALSTYLGYVDGIRDRFVHGWVINQQDPTQSVLVYLYHGSNIIAETQANIFRDDLMREGYASANHGFAIALPDSLDWTKPHDLRVTVGATGQHLDGSPVRFMPEIQIKAPLRPAYRGYVDGIANDHVHGWAMNVDDHSETLHIELIERDRVLGRWPAHVQRDDLSAAGINNSLHGFAIPIPQEIKDGTPHDLKVVIAENGQLLEGAPLEYVSVHSVEKPLNEPIDSKSLLLGRVESVEDNKITGWCVFKDRPENGVVLELRLQKQVIARVVADQDRDDLKVLGFENTRHGFSIEIPQLIQNGKLFSITLVEPSTEEVIEGGVIDYTADTRHNGPRVIGNFEGLRGLNLHGWAFDEDRPDKPVELYVTVDGSAKKMVIADRPRSDVALAGIGNGHNGFECELPATILDGNEHQVSVVLADSGTLLDGSPITVYMPREGVAFVNRTNATIDGWARNASEVVVRFDNGDKIITRFDRPVAGFLSSDTPGFRVSIPHALLDNTWHRADVTYGNDDSSLDGSPILFRLTKPATVLDYITLSGRRVMGRAYDSVDSYKVVSLSVEVDDEPFATITADGWRAAEPQNSSERVPHEFHFLLPVDVTRFALRRIDGLNKSLLGTWRVGGDLWSERPSAIVSSELSRESIEAPETINGVKQALDAFFRNPADDFDEAWYLINYWQVSEKIAENYYSSALDHYRKTGMMEGYSPSAFFDEAGVRATFAPIAEAIQKGALPSAFGLYLYLKQVGTFDPLPGITLPTGRYEYKGTKRENPLVELRKTGLSELRPQVESKSDDRGLSVTLLPPRRGERDASNSIYTAWLDRLCLALEDQATLSVQEVGARNFVASTGLVHPPLVSIIMPTFNRAYTIAEAIQSVLDQSYQNWELLICDDASTDRTPIVVAQFPDKRVRYMQFEKSNGAATRNKGLRYAKGEYIAYLDSDNLWDPLFLDIMMRFLLANPGQFFAYSGYLDTEIIGCRVNLEKLSLPEFSGVQLSSRNFIDLNTIMHHRLLIDWLGGFDEKLERLQDWDLVLRFASIFTPVFVPYCLAFYRRNAAWGQVTHLFLESNMQRTVAEKTQERLEGGHVRLQIKWPKRPRLALIQSSEATDVKALLAFAKLASPYADITLVSHESQCKLVAEGCSNWTVPEKLISDPVRLGYSLSLIPDCAAVVSFGGDHPSLRRLSRQKIAPVFLAVLESDGLYLTNVDRSQWSFHIGTLPLHRDEWFGDWAPASPNSIVGTLFSLPGQPAASCLSAINAVDNFELLLAPSNLFEPTWSVFRGGEIQPLQLEGEMALSVARQHSKITVCATPLGELSMLAQSFVFDRLGAGIPTMLVPESYGRKLTEANAAFSIDVLEYSWILDKLPKLFNSDATLEKLRKNGRRSYLACLHPELVQERIVSFIYQLAFCDNSERVVHVA